MAPSPLILIISTMQVTIKTMSDDMTIKGAKTPALQVKIH